MKYIKPFTAINNLQLIVAAQVIVLFAIWFMMPNMTFPSPIEIIEAWNKLALQQGLLPELMNSAFSVLKSIILASLITLILTMLATLTVVKSAITWLTALRFLGFAGITYLFTLWTSDGGELKLWLLTFGMTTFLLTNSLATISSITQDEIDYARTLKLDGWQLTYEIAFRGKLDEYLNLIRQNAAIGWTLLSMVEGLVRSEGGIGALLLNQSKHLRLSEIFAIQLTILVYGIVQDKLFQYLREVVCPYVKLTEAKR